MTTPSALAVARAGLRTLLAAHLVTVWGTQWDVRRHLLIGRDSFWIPPHLMTYSGVTVIVPEIHISASGCPRKPSTPVPTRSGRMFWPDLVLIQVREQRSALLLRHVHEARRVRDVDVERPAIRTRARTRT